MTIKLVFSQEEIRQIVGEHARKQLANKEVRSIRIDVTQGSAEQDRVAGGFVVTAEVEMGEPRARGDVRD